MMRPIDKAHAQKRYVASLSGAASILQEAISPGGPVKRPQQSPLQSRSRTRRVKSHRKRCLGGPFCSRKSVKS